MEMLADGDASGKKSARNGVRLGRMNGVPRGCFRMGADSRWAAGCAAPAGSNNREPMAP